MEIIRAYPGDLAPFITPGLTTVHTARVIQLENLVLGILINEGVVLGLELVDTYVGIIDCEERILLEDDLTLLDLPSGEETPPLARRLPHDEGRTRWLVGPPVPGLTLLRAVGDLLADAAFQLLFSFRAVNLAEVARGHIGIFALWNTENVYTFR